MTLVTPGNVILVTGSTGAIGFEIAVQGAEQGAVIGVHGSSTEKVAATIDRLRMRVPDARLVAVPQDLRAPGAAVALIEAIVGEAGRLDAVINCATVGTRARITGLFAQTEAAGFVEHAGNVIGLFQELAQAALPHLAKQGGTLITFASDAGRFAAPRQAVVGAAFGGLMAFVRNLAMEVSRDGVRVHCISPSFVAETPVFEDYAKFGARAMAAFKRAGLGLPAPRDIAPTALFLCGPGAAKITGQVISINGGLNV